MQRQPSIRLTSRLCHRKTLRGQQAGFTLILTLSLMVLLVMVGVGMLSLSSISLRSSTLALQQSIARANARMALQLAIGQLQRETGIDACVTTTADQRMNEGDGSASSAASERKRWTGVYDSWSQSENDRPEPKFRSWLVSGDRAMSSEATSVENSNQGESTIELVGSGTVSNAADGKVLVPASPVTLGNNAPMRLAWWTSDQGVKATLNTPELTKDTSVAAVRGTAQASPRNAIEISSHGEEKPFASVDARDERLSYITSWQQAGLMSSDYKQSNALFHQLAASNSGLLTNVRKGGFRKDLSMKFELMDGNSATEALYQVKNSNGTNESGINLRELWAFYKLTDQLKTNGNTQFTTDGSLAADANFLQVVDTPNDCETDDFFFFKQPVIISYQMVLSFQTQTTQVGSQSVNRLHVVADPILTLWNPLDVAVVVPAGNFFTVKYWQVPYDLWLSINGAAPKKYPLAASLTGAVNGSNGDGNYMSLRIGNLKQLAFQPGEVIKFSQSGNIIVKGSNPVDHNLEGNAGFNYGGGVSLPVRDLAGQYIDLNLADTITYTVAANNLTAGKTSTSGNSVNGNNAHSRHFSLTHHECYVGDDRIQTGPSYGYGGMLLDYDFGNKRLLRSDSLRADNAPGTKPPGERLYADRFPNIFRPLAANDARPLTVSQLQSEKAPFMLLSYSAKTEMGSDRGTRYLSRFNPRVHHVDFYDFSDFERDALPYEFSVEPLVSWKNRNLEVTSNGRAYYGGSMNAEFGNSFLTTHSVPREPIVSLGALQHSCANGFEFLRPPKGYATLNAREPMLPQISHAIGNSMAAPMLAADQTQTTISGGRPYADHSYLANLGLWDDWFFSGITPQTRKTFSSPRSQSQVAKEFYEGKTKLPTSRYVANLNSDEITAMLSKLFTGNKPTTSAQDLVASTLMVDGAINVNSTSVEAWKAWLGGMRDQNIVVRNEAGKENTVATDKITPVSNLLAPLDREVDATNNLDVKSSDQWVGRRTLTDEQIEALATGIVREVRKRGPFLSLADFVNRRVGKDKNLARCGAVQAALDAPDVKINSAFLESDRRVADAVTSRFAFAEAESGTSAFGCPTLIKQGDVLTPIAPLLTVRSDTFLIRAYGESVDASGAITARAWCEATVQRDKNFIDAADPCDTAINSLQKPVNQIYGRRYHMVSFRWLSPNEI